MGTIGILLISDVHFGCPDPNNEHARITGALVKATKRLRVDDKKVDLIIFSGDLAFSGKEA